MGDFRKKIENLRFFRIFVEFQNFSKTFPKIFFVKNRQNIVSFRSYARLNKIEAKYVILEHFEIFRFLKIFQKIQNFHFFRKKKFCHGNRVKITNFQYFLLKSKNGTWNRY